MSEILWPEEVYALPPPVTFEDSASSSSSRQKVNPVSTSPPPQTFYNQNSATEICSGDLTHFTQHYIPVGSLRIERIKYNIDVSKWESCDQWQALIPPQQVADSAKQSFVDFEFQEILLRSTCLAPFRNLHAVGWIRLEFKAKDNDWGQFRVWILPDDRGHSKVDRQDTSMRRSMRNLIAQLDMSACTWNSAWQTAAPVLTIQERLHEEHELHISLFDLYNTLPSPTPDPKAVQEPAARSAMENILNGDVDGLKTKMMAYQKRSAAMMLQRESEPAQVVDPRLRPLADQNGQTWYVDLHTTTCMRNPRMYETAKGGICAENMGYGKTLICLALILVTKDYSSQIPAEFSVGTLPVRPRVGSLLDMVAATIGRTGTPWKSHFSALLQNHGEDYVQCVDAIRRGVGYYHIPDPTPRRSTRNPVSKSPRKVYLSTLTLVVVPPNLVRQWIDEIKKHTTGLKVLVMNNKEVELPPALELLEYDIILFSRIRFEQEAKDGSDHQGRRATSSRNVCRYMCSLNKKTGRKECDCFQADRVYNSPLRELHFKRLITDEGHNMGNSGRSTKSNAVVVVDFLQISSRWIVSGTPTPSLYGAEKTPEFSAKKNTASTEKWYGLPGLDNFQKMETKELGLVENDWGAPQGDSSGRGKQSGQNEIERKDLEKLGNIATTYLKTRPWANSVDDNDSASWSQYILQPRYNQKNFENMACLRDALVGMIIRHRKEDVEMDVDLPTLHQKIVYIEGSSQDKLSLNLFALMINSNAVTSERKDADYLFHPRQRRALASLVANLRQASFFWSGYTQADVEFTKNVAQKFLENVSAVTSDNDKNLLVEGIASASAALMNSTWQKASKYHEMSMCISNEFDEKVREAWALNGIMENPTLLGASQVLSLQKFVNANRQKSLSTTKRLLETGRSFFEDVRESKNRLSSRIPITGSRNTKKQKRPGEALPELAGGLKIGNGQSPRKRVKTAAINNFESLQKIEQERRFSDSSQSSSLESTRAQLSEAQSALNLKPSNVDDYRGTGSSQSVLVERNTYEAMPMEMQSLLSAQIVSTGSAKLSYLMDQVVKYYQEEKIIIFYENDNVAYYISQALDALTVEHLIYAKTLTADRRSRYLITFNTTSRFRCLLMDVSQAAFGLDISSASRVYFINPVLSKHVEAQAVKRAHRIGQLRSVHVETLVLRGSIEEMIVERRQAMSTEEQTKCKTVLDDQTMYDWIKNVRFVPLAHVDAPYPNQMAKLSVPQLLFGQDVADDGAAHPDSGLVGDRTEA